MGRGRVDNRGVTELLRGERERDQIVEFLRIQLCIHHPRGTHTDEEGAWATNDALWKV